MNPENLYPSFQGHGLGALRQQRDPRDRLYRTYLATTDHDRAKAPELPARATVAMDAEVPIFDQGQLGSCTANEGVAHYMILQAVEGKAVQALSRLQVYRNARMLLNPRFAKRDSGATGRAVAKTLATDGACPETGWPYKISKFKDAPPSACIHAGLDHQLMQYLAIQSGQADTLDLIRTSIAAGYPVGFSFDVYQNFQPDGQGVIPMPHGGIEGGHRMLLVGYDTAAGLFDARNSWGKSWGLAGRCKFHDDHVTQFFSDYWSYRLIE